jgi:hypothetical protein
MPRWQNALALLATIAAAGALLPLTSRERLLCVAAAVGMILVALTLRLRAHGRQRGQARVPDTYARIERIRAQRAGRRR